MSGRGLLAACLWLAAASAFAEAPGGVAVDAFNATGDGCPAGTAVINVAPDAGAFTVLFSSYVVEAGASAGTGQARRTCNLDLRLRVPPGWTFSVDAVDFRGYAALGPSARGQQVSSLAYPPRMALTKLASLDLFGPSDDSYQNHVDVPTAARIWAPCVGATRQLLLRTSVAVTTRLGSNGLMTVDSADGRLAHRYGLRWQMCR